MAHHSNIAIVILAAGKGTRMKSNTHKVLHQIAGYPLLDHVLNTAHKLEPERTILVLGALKEQFTQYTDRVDIIEQYEQLGTGHAVQCAMEKLADFQGDVVVLYGDVPFVSADNIFDLVSARRENAGTMISVLGFETDKPNGYGRLIRNKDGSLNRIVEEKDASDKEKTVTLCNSGIMAINSDYLSRGLDRLENNNNSGEFYLTDLVAHARSDGFQVALTICNEDAVHGINSRADLAKAEMIFQQKARHKAMGNGATLVAPDTVFFAADTVLGRDVVIEPNIVFGRGVKIADGVTIKGFSHIEGATIGENATIGPFARIRPGTMVGSDVKIGNFVEIKKADISSGAKISHLSYIGDASVGQNANIGAGTITCNYDGYFKYRTDIEDGAFIGSNTALVAPVTVGRDAIVGAGSVITKDIQADAIAIGRAPQTNKENAAKRFRSRAEVVKNNGKNK